MLNKLNFLNRIGDNTMKRYRSKLIPGMLFLTLFLCSFMLVNSEPMIGSENSPTPNSTIRTEVQTQEVDPEAVEILRNALEYLSNLKQFSVQAQSTLEDILESGHRVDFEISSSVTVSRPNKLHSERHSKLFNQIFYYDGKTLTLYNPTDKVYAVEPAPGTIEDMFHFARDTYGLGAPVSDLIYNNSFELLMYEVNFAAVIGKEMIGDVHCDHLLFSRPGADFQIWIANEGPPLPLKYVVTDTATPELLSYTIYMRDWNITPALSESLFNFVPPAGTQKITFLEAEPTQEFEK
jgi:hypothetical protein